MQRTHFILFYFLKKRFDLGLRLSNHPLPAAEQFGTKMGVCVRAMAVAVWRQLSSTYAF